MYLYAVKHLKIKSITHKFLICGHTQNEGDNVHSVIEKAIRRVKSSGPIYTPDQYITIIRSAKKTGKPYAVNELNHCDFLDLKDLCSQIGNNFTKNTNGDTFHFPDIKVLKVDKDNPFKFYYKTSYKENFQEVDIRSSRKSRSNSNFQLTLKKVYNEKINISENKKKDIFDLLEKGLLPSYYKEYYKQLFN